MIAEYKAALALKGDRERGAQIFTKTCAGCHRLDSLGRTVGADLAAVREKDPEWFLPALFDPSRAMDARYVSYTAVTRDGNAFSGFLSAESAQSITLVGPTGEPRVILRANLELLSSSGKSAMPEGLEEGLSLEDVADLIAFLRRE